MRSLTCEVDWVDTVANNPQLRAILDAKGRNDGNPVATNANAIPVRRVLGLAEAFARKPLAGSRVLDLACQEGCYALEFALAGADAVGVEARDYHIERAGICATQSGGAARTRFDLGDIRDVTEASHGRFDIVLMLGILYHLDAKDAAETLSRLAVLTDDMLIIDTHIALSNKASFDWRGRTYEGAYVREHGDKDTDEQRHARRQASIDNTFAFYFTRQALARLLFEVGFPVVVEALTPLDATKPSDRATFVAMKRPARQGVLYPWINGLTEDQIAAAASSYLPPLPGGGRVKVARMANTLLHKFGFTLTPR